MPSSETSRQSPLTPSHRAAPFPEQALLFTIAAHLSAMASMMLLLPGLPGGMHMHIADRAAYVGRHSWVWRIGWLPWQITAFSDLLIAVALLCTPWIPKLPALLTFIATAAGIVPDQTGQWRWTWFGTGLAARAMHTGKFAAYSHFEMPAFLRIAGWGTVGYLAAAIAWTWCFAGAGVWSKRLTWLSIILWPLFAILTALLLFIPMWLGNFTRPAATVALMIVGAGNGLCFVLLMLWLFCVTEAVLARSRPTTRFGRYAPWRYPSRGWLASLSEIVANSRMVRAFGEWLPALEMNNRRYRDETGDVHS